MALVETLHPRGRENERAQARLRAPKSLEETACIVFSKFCQTDPKRALDCDGNGATALGCDMKRSTRRSHTEAAAAHEPTTLCRGCLLPCAYSGL